MKPTRWRLIAALFLSCTLPAFAAPYPTEIQLRAAIEKGAGVLKGEGLEMEILDARKEGVALPLLAAGLSLTNGVCVVFYNPQPADVLTGFFDGVDEKDLPLWLDAIAVHEATHCVEQREAYLRQRFDKVLPPDLKRDGMTVDGYLSVVKSGMVENWGEALADIASVLYLKQEVPERWTYFASGLAALRQQLAGSRPEHDTSPWLRKLIAASGEEVPGRNIFEAAFELRREFARPSGG